ncbi:hypothetical protein ACIBCR_01390 [Micromonospora echinospora]|uniref:hypothetical protein n=1 Tax=Micromonospora echinospora TaxID=1877 RepID=UPI003795F6B6
MTWYDIFQGETRDGGYGARHRSSPLRTQARLPATQRTKAARRGGVFLAVGFLAPLAALGACFLTADDGGKGDPGRAERQEHLWTGDTDLSSWSSVDPAGPASRPDPTAAGAAPPASLPTAQPMLLDDFD